MQGRLTAVSRRPRRTLRQFVDGRDVDDGLGKWHIVSTRARAPAHARGGASRGIVPTQSAGRQRAGGAAAATGNRHVSGGSSGMAARVTAGMAGVSSLDGPKRQIIELTRYPRLHTY